MPSSIFLRVELPDGEYLDTVTMDSGPSVGDLVQLSDGVRFVVDSVVHTPYRRRDHESILVVSPFIAKDSKHSEVTEAETNEDESSQANRLVTEPPRTEVAQNAAEKQQEAKKAPAKKAPVKKASPTAKNAYPHAN